MISASRRTDLPAFYSQWFMNRVRAGFCHWINPFNHHVYRVSLKPEDCLAIVFWTRNPSPLMPHLKYLQEEGYNLYFHFTLNDYSRILETHRPSKNEAIRAFRQLSDILSPERVYWRYDPILLSALTDISHHLRKFEDLIRKLQGFCSRCTTSFADFYHKTRRNLKMIEKRAATRFRVPSPIERNRLMRDFQAIARSKGMRLYTCCDHVLCDGKGDKSGCIHEGMIQIGIPDTHILPKRRPTRKGCHCIESTDIGAYDTCTYGCVYCYATRNRVTALDRLSNHNPEDTVLWRPKSLHDKRLDEEIRQKK
jgi:DNA repair photolyase